MVSEADYDFIHAWMQIWKERALVAGWKPADDSETLLKEIDMTWTKFARSFFPSSCQTGGIVKPLKYRFRCLLETLGLAGVFVGPIHQDGEVSDSGDESSKETSQ